MDWSTFGIHGAHRRTDLVARFGRRPVEQAIAYGQLQPLWRVTLVEGARFFDPLARASAGLIVAGPTAVITGGTAAVLHGCEAIEPRATHVLVPYGNDTKSRPGLAIHRGGFYAEDVGDVSGLPVLTLERATADLLCTARSGDGIALADEVLRRAKDDHENVRRRILGKIQSRQDPRGTVSGARLLDLATPRSASPAESWFRLRLIDEGIPLPEVNWPLVDLAGVEIYVLDLAWPSLRIVVEYDGYAAHVGREAADRAREEDLRRRGWIVVRASCEDLTRIDRVCRDLRKAFERRGYTW
jgi:hypothetical protein